MEKDPLIKAGKPTLELLESLQTDVSHVGSSEELWGYVEKSDRTRFCIWPGQTPDGKKRADGRGKDAFPWDGAADTRPMLVDRDINLLVCLCFTAFWRAITSGKASDTEASGYAVAVLDKLVNDKLLAHLTDEAELSAQYMFQYGWVVLHPCWKQEFSLRRQRLTMEQLVQIGQGLAALYPDMPIFQNFAAAVMEEESEEAVVQALQMVLDTYARSQIGEAGELEVPQIRPKVLRKAVRSLRETNEASFPIPYLCKNEPAIYACKPWTEVILSNDTTDLEESRVIFRREYVSEARLRARIATEDYDPEWVEEALKQKETFTTRPTFEVGDQQGLTAPARNSEARSHLVEVIHAYYRALDEDEVPAIYCTTFHRAVKTVKGDNSPLYAKHALVDYPHGQFPFVLGKRENLVRLATFSRGVPEIGGTWQNEEKAIRDATIDWTSLGVIPPVNVYDDPRVLKYRFAPAAQNHVRAGREPKYMDLPGTGVSHALATLEKLEVSRAAYFGTFHPLIPPEATNLVGMRTVQRFLVMWVSAFQQMLSLVQGYMPDAQFAEMTGAPQGWLDQKRNQMGLLTAGLSFDVRELSDEMTLKLIETINKTILPGDATGSIKRAEWTAIQLRALKPAWARQLLVPAPEASQALFNQVRNDVSQMFLGNPPQLVENDPSAEAKKQFVQQIIQSNPNYQEALQDQTSRFRELMEVYMKNLDFSTQQEQNKTIGRLGVQPVA